jgi:hypothetical protein
MESRVKLFGHPVHPMLIVFPLGLLGMAVIFDIVNLAFTGNGYWSEISYWMIAAGVVTGLLAAPFGLVDWFAIPSGTRAKRIGAIHGVGNVDRGPAVRLELVHADAEPASAIDAGVSPGICRSGARTCHGLARWRAGRPAGRLAWTRART